MCCATCGRQCTNIPVTRYQFEYVYICMCSLCYLAWSLLSLLVVTETPKTPAPTLTIPETVALLLISAPPSPPAPLRMRVPGLGHRWPTDRLTCVVLSNRATAAQRRVTRVLLLCGHYRLSAILLCCDCLACDHSCDPWVT